MKTTTSGTGAACDEVGTIDAGSLTELVKIGGSESELLTTASTGFTGSFSAAAVWAVQGANAGDFVFNSADTGAALPAIPAVGVTRNLGIGAVVTFCRPERGEPDGARRLAIDPNTQTVFWAAR